MKYKKVKRYNLYILNNKHFYKRLRCWKESWKAFPLELDIIFKLGEGTEVNIYRNPFYIYYLNIISPINSAP